MFQVGGKKWKMWNRRFQAVLNANQHDEGYWETAAATSHGPKQGILDNKIYATTLCALQLTVYCRYLPSIGKGGFAQKEKEHKNVLKSWCQPLLMLIATVGRLIKTKSLVIQKQEIK